MESSTKILRRMLDERGVEHYEHEAPATDCIAFFDGNGWHDCWESVDGEVNVTFSMTPEQAIVATLGTGTCHNVNHGLTFVCSECGANVDTASSIGYSYVDEFGKRCYGASNDYGLNYCPNCGAKVVAE